jgi:hypothetical protein
MEEWSLVITDSTCVPNCDFDTFWSPIWSGDWRESWRNSELVALEESYSYQQVSQQVEHTYSSNRDVAFSTPSVSPSSSPTLTPSLCPCLPVPLLPSLPVYLFLSLRVLSRPSHQVESHSAQMRIPMRKVMMAVE